MRVQVLKKEFLDSLSNIYEAEEILTLYYESMQRLLDWDRAQCVLNEFQELSEHKTQQLLEVLQRLTQNEPIQYIFGETEFYGLNLKVNEAVLIPRPETEELVDMVLESAKKLLEKKEPIRIYDLCTGSGCIAIALAKHLGEMAEIIAVDISEKALEIAKENAVLNQVQITFCNHDILTLKKLKENHIIVSNPPYVKEKEKHAMRPNVLDFEPSLALFVKDDDPLVFYKKIMNLAECSRTEEVFFEINEALGAETMALGESNFKIQVLKKDFRGRDRMLHFQKD